jgi:integrase
VTKALLSDAIDDWFALRRSTDISKNTIANERGVLRRLLAVNGNIWVHQIDERHVTRYFEDASKTRQPTTLQLDHTVLAQFFDWARRTKRLPLDVDPMAGRRRPRKRHKERDRLHVSQFNHLLDVAEAQDPRNRAVVAVLLYTLIRDQEAADLRIGDVDLNAGYLHVRITKSHTEDMMPICAEFDTELRQWLTVYAAETRRRLQPNDFLLPRRQSGGLVKDEGGRIEGHEMFYDPSRPIARVGRVASSVLTDFGWEMRDRRGKSKMEGAHTIRRSGARALFDRLSADSYDHSLRIVQSMLHHSSVSLTERYIGVTADRRSRDELIRGQRMYAPALENVVELGKEA